MDIRLQDIAQSMQDIRKTAGLFIQMNLTALNMAHIQNIVDQT